MKKIKELQNYFSFQIDEKMVTYSSIDMNIGNIKETCYEIDFNFFVPKFNEKAHMMVKLKLSYHIYKNSASPKKVSFSIKNQNNINTKESIPITNFKNSHSIFLNNYMVKMNKEHIIPFLKKKITKNIIHAHLEGQDIELEHYNVYNQNLVKEFKEYFDILVGSITAKKPLDSSLEITDFNELIRTLEPHEKKKMFIELNKKMVIKDEKTKVIKI